MTDRDLIAELRGLADAARAETLKPGWPFGGSGVQGWHGNLNGLLGGPVGEYCAALDPDRLDALLDALEAAQRPPLGYVVAIRYGDSTPPEPEVIYWDKEGAQRDARWRTSLRGDDWRAYEVTEVQP